MDNSLKSKTMYKSLRAIGLWIVVLVSLLIHVKCERSDELTTQVEFLEPNYFGICFAGRPSVSNPEVEVVITDQNSYYEYWNIRRLDLYNMNCDTAKLPEINFDKYSLIGRYTEGGGCDATYTREIIEYNMKNKIVYKIDVNGK